MQKLNILVVDDEAMLRDAVASYLRKAGHHVLEAETGTQALEIFHTQPVSFIVLDLMLPDLSGEEVCARIRQSSKVPVLMLTAKSMEEDILEGLRLGADDYMTKPFSLRELAARIEAIARRCADSVPLPEAGPGGDGLEVDLERLILKKRGTQIFLTPIEWKLLSAFLRHPKRVFTRDDLLLAAFDTAYDGYDRVIDTHIKNLRKKLEDNPKKPVYIRTVHGIGYRFGGEEV